VEDACFLPAFQRHLQCPQTELCVKAVRELPAEHVPGEKIPYRHQVEQTLLQRDVGDIGRQTSSTAVTSLRSNRHGQPSEGSPGTVVRGFW